MRFSNIILMWMILCLWILWLVEQKIFIGIWASHLSRTLFLLYALPFGWYWLIWSCCFCESHFYKAQYPFLSLYVSLLFNHLVFGSVYCISLFAFSFNDYYLCTLQCGSVAETVAYDIVLEVAMKVQKFQQRNLLLHGPWKWLLTEFATYYGVSEPYTKLRYWMKFIC